MSHLVPAGAVVAGVHDCGNIFSFRHGPCNSGWSKTVRDNPQELASGTAAS